MQRDLALPSGPAQLLWAMSPESGGDGSWEELEGDMPGLPGGDVGSVGAGSRRDIHQPAQLAAGEVSEGNSFLSLLTWAAVELLTWR